MDVVEINRFHVRTEVGFNPHELGKLQELVITIHLKTSKKAGQTDRVEDTINYKKIGKDMLFHVENKKYNLIESVASDIARICVVRHGVPWVRVLVEKPNALRFSDCTAVTIERRLEDFDWEDVHISIGSNINPLQNIPKAIGLLEEKVQLKTLSKAFRTTPMGFKEQDDFINMAAVMRTKLDPAGLKQVLTNVEQQLGRVRDPNNKNAPRTIDLDISFWGDTVLEYNVEIKGKSRAWSIPEPDVLQHAHVVIPLADVTPEFIHPMENKTLRMIAMKVSGVEDFTTFFPIVQISEMERDGLSDKIMTNVENVSSSRKTAAIGKSLNQSNGYPVALITGATKRLGACITRRLHAVGYNICLHYNTSKVEATSLLQELNSLRVNSVRLVQADLSCDTQLAAERIVRESLEIWGQLDVLVNNASQFYPTEVGQIKEKDWNDLMQTNLSGPFFLSQAAFPSLKASGGCIVNLIDADRPLANHSVCCISNAGLQMCTLALAKDFAPHVRVNGVAPGAISWAEKEREEASVAAANGSRHKVTHKILMGRKGDLSHIASTVEFLASDAGYITGQVINVDGGRTANSNVALQNGNNA